MGKRLGAKAGQAVKLIQRMRAAMMEVKAP